jgi:uncharacterized membrane protein
MSAADPEQPAVGGLSTARIQALCDGVFAVAMTLLILDVKVPLSSHDLPGHLYALRFKVLSYVFSFVILGIYWVGHHNQYHYIRRADRTLLWLNLLFFLTIAFIPFSAALIAEHYQERIAVIVYGVNLILAGAVLYVIWWYATAGYRLVDRTLNPDVIRMAKIKILQAPVVYAGAIAVSFLNPAISIVAYVLVPILYILPSSVDRQFAQVVSHHHEGAMHPGFHSFNPSSNPSSAMDGEGVQTGSPGTDASGHGAGRLREEA